MAAEVQSEGASAKVVPFGKYLLDALIAEGGMARVYRARLRGALGFEKPLVVKQVRPELARDPRFVAMFVEEAKTLVRLSHPHIVPIYELGVVDGTYFLAMELVDGATLATLLREGPLPPTLVARLGEQVAEALHHAHDRFGLVHRDVTPRNVLVDVEGHARLVDFGIATPAEGVGGEVFGSPGYMSPEQLRGESLDARSDLFALGALLYQCLGGSPAFLPPDVRDAKKASELAKRATLDGSPPPLPETVPEELRTLVDACLRRDRAERPESALVLARALRTWLAHAAPAGVGAELGARVRQAVVRASIAPDDDGPITVTSKKGEIRSLATSSILTDALAASAEPALATKPLTGRVRPEASTAPPSARDESASNVSTAPLADDAPATSEVGSAESTDTADPPVASAARPTTTAESSAMELARDARPRRALVFGALAIVAVVALSIWATTPPPVSSPPEPVVVHEPAPPPEPPPEVPTSEAPPEVASTAPPDTPEHDPVAARGTLTVHATPWADVQLDGRPLGTTPLRRTTVSAGAHVLVFDNPPLGRSLRVPIRVEPGASVRVLADLSTDAPRARIR